jgi:acyl-CoA synthetase (AMP-forming)/AMP-acid ligase II
MSDPGAAAPIADAIDDLVRRAAARHPDRCALVCGGQRRSFAELEARVARLAAALAAVVEPGDRVAILARNRVEYAEAYLGVPRAGAVLVPLHPRLHPDEWTGLLRRAGPRVLLAEEEPLTRLGEATVRAAGVELVVGLDPGAGSRPYERFLADAPTPTPGGPGRAEGSEVAWIIPTSGTTGPPRLAMLTHAGLLAAVAATTAARPVDPDDVLATPFPLCHVAGYTLLVAWAAARPVVVLARFDPAELVHAVAAEGVTTCSLAPTMIAALLDHLSERRGGTAELASLRRITYGASPMPPAVLRRAVRQLGVDLWQGYGMTELSGNAVFLGPDAHRAAAAGDGRLASAAGRPAPGVEVRIGDGGEILVRAPQVMAGYWDDPDATAAAIVDGWLHTGDAGSLDDHGDLHVVDRIKDVIVTGGENVASREVEDVLSTHPAVADVAVIGLPDQRWGERVTAVVVARPGRPAPTLDELHAHVRARLAGFKAPRRLVLVDELPRDHAGKVRKRALRERLAPTPPGGGQPNAPAARSASRRASS